MKNVILITMDAVRPDHLSCYGYDKIETKAIDEIAKEGLVFRNVIATSCLTPVAHASILSGKNPDKTGVRDPFSKVQTRLISNILKENGYTTAGFTGIDFLSRRVGFDTGFDVFDEPTDETAWKKKTYKSDGRVLDSVWGNWWIPKMLDFIEKNKSIPFFIWGHYFNVHFHAEKQMLKDGKLKKGVLSDNAYYDAKMVYMDENLFKPMIKTLKDNGLRDDTTIVITSDHGESFQYDYPQHRTLYDSDLKIPLIIKDKDLPHHYINKTARSIDIVPTLIKLLDIKTNEKFDGKDLCWNAIFDFDNVIAYSEELFPHRGPGILQSIRTDDVKVIYNRSKDTVEVYNLRNDPEEKHNILDETYESMKNTLTTKEEHKIKERLKRLGYIE